MWELFLDASRVEQLANAFLIVITGLGIVLTWRIRKPQPATNENPQRVEVAGALIDAEQAKLIVRAIEVNTEAHRQTADKLLRVENTTEQLVTAIHDLRIEMRLANNGPAARR